MAIRPGQAGAAPRFLGRPVRIAMLNVAGLWPGARRCLRTAADALRRHPWRVACGVGLALALGVTLYLFLAHLNARAHLRSARAALERWDFDQARSDLAVCLRAWPRDGSVHHLAAQAARRAGRYEEAQRHLHECEALGYRTYGTALESMLLRAQTGHLAEVEDTLRQCVARDDLDSPLILETLALSYVHLYDLLKAGQSLDLLLAREPRNGLALLWRGRVHSGLNRFDLAEKDYRKAIELHPDYVEPRLELANRLLAQNVYGEAAEQYEKALALRPRDPKALLGLARCRRQQGDNEGARRLLDELLADHPRDAAALAQRGQVALDALRFEEAEGFLRHSLEVAPQDQQTLYSLQQSLTHQGKTPQAREVLRRAEQIRADQERLYKLIRALDKAPDDPSLYAQAGALCLRNGQEREGLRWLGGALRKDPWHAPTHALLADYHQRKGNAELAARHRRLATPQGRPPGRPPAGVAPASDSGRGP
jgi:tetratricopeptide (TPR) repeat protein